MKMLIPVLVVFSCSHLSNAFPFFHLSRSAQKEIPNSVLSNGGVLNTNAVAPAQSSPVGAANTAAAAPASQIDFSVTAQKDGINTISIATEASPNAPKMAVENTANKPTDLYTAWNAPQFKDLQPIFEQTTVSEIWKDINRVLSGDIPQTPLEPINEGKNNIESPTPFAFEFDVGAHKAAAAPNLAGAGVAPSAKTEKETPTFEMSFKPGPAQPLPQALAQVQPLSHVRKFSVQENKEHFLTGDSLINSPQSLSYIRLRKLNDTYNDFVSHLHSVLEKNKIVYEKQLDLLKSIDHPYIVDEVNAPNLKGETGRPWYMRYFDMGEQAMVWALEKTDKLQKKLELYKEKLQEIGNDLQYGDYWEPRSLEKQNEHVYDGYFKVF